MNRAQVTLFALLGIVFLIILLFLLFVASSVKKQVTKEVEKSVTHTDVYAQIKSYITSCLEKSAKGGLLLLGLQGYIPTQITKEKQLLFFEYPVAYGVEEPRYSLQYPPAPVPQYPHVGKLVKNDFPYFGKDTLHDLCDPEGPNRIGATAFARSCESYEPKTSLQYQLVQFIRNQTLACLNFSVLRFPTNPTGPLVVNVTIGNADVLITMEYPVTFSSYDKGRVSELFALSTKTKVRLKTIHEFAKALIDKETHNIFFDPVKEGQLLPQYQGGFVLHKVQNACPTCKGNEFDDIIALSDTLSEIDGKTYLFQFARENRIPALDWIHDVSPTVMDYDILVDENSELAIHPAGRDPDEETNLRYTYSGWKGDYDERFDEACPTLRTNPQLCVQRISLAPHAWSQSDLFKQTKQNASIHVSHADIGKHIVRVTVTDRQGLSDYQDIVVFVRDRPFFNLTGRFYHDLPSLLASVEDPFLLQSVVRCIFWDCGKEFEWRIFKQFAQTPYKIYKTEKESFLLPSDTPEIHTIRREPFAETTERVKFKGGQFEFDLQGLKILTCLPHRDADPTTPGIQDYDPSNPIHLPYPFQQGNAFQAPHVCCESGVGDYYENAKKVARGEKVEKFGEFSLPTKVCYATTKYICSPYLDTFDPKKIIAAKHVDTAGNVIDLQQQATLSPPAQYDGHDNDIYKVSFTQHCSGNRGNVCGGVADYKIELQQGCVDLAADEDERCSGPLSTVDKNTCFTQGITPACFTYAPGNSFEKNILKLPTADGFCNNNEKLSLGEGGSYGAGGPFLCKAQCNGAGSCSYAADCACPQIHGNPCSGRKPSEVGQCINFIICDGNCQQVGACS